MIQDPLLIEHYELKKLTTYKEWRHYIKLLGEHQAFLQKEVNRCVREQNLIGAYGFLARFDDIPRIMGKVVQRIKSTKKEGG